MNRDPFSLSLLPLSVPVMIWIVILWTSFSIRSHVLIFPSSHLPVHCSSVRVMCMFFSSIHLRLLTWEMPEWRQAGRRRFTTGDENAIAFSPSKSWQVSEKETEKSKKWRACDRFCTVCDFFLPRTNTSFDMRCICLTLSIASFPSTRL